MSTHEAIQFYCGIGEQQWNHHPVAPGPLACISPVYGNTTEQKYMNRVAVPQRLTILGAFRTFLLNPDNYN